MMGETIEHGGGHFGVTEHLRPIGEGEIGGNKQGGVLVELADQVEQQLAGRRVWVVGEPFFAVGRNANNRRTNCKDCRVKLG